MTTELRKFHTCVPFRAALALVWLSLPGCSYHTEPLSGQPGTLTMNTPGSFPRVVSGPSAPAHGAPAGTSETATGSPAAPAAEGRYRGVAVADNPGDRCRSRVEISNWTVSGDRVRFGAFRGTIQPDGSLMMQAGQAYVKGRFNGPDFTGQYWEPGRGCTFSLALSAAQ